MTEEQMAEAMEEIGIAMIEAIDGLVRSRFPGLEEPQFEAIIISTACAVAASCAAAVGRSAESMTALMAELMAQVSR